MMTHMVTVMKCQRVQMSLLHGDGYAVPKMFHSIGTHHLFERGATERRRTSEVPFKLNTWPRNRGLALRVEVRLIEAIPLAPFHEAADFEFLCWDRGSGGTKSARVANIRAQE